MRYCKDCEYVRDLADYDGKFATCAHPRLTATDPVLGATAPTDYCRSMRELNWPLALIYGECGRYGRWFKPKA